MDNKIHVTTNQLTYSITSEEGQSWFAPNKLVVVLPRSAYRAIQLGKYGQRSRFTLVWTCLDCAENRTFKSDGMSMSWLI